MEATATEKLVMRETRDHRVGYFVMRLLDELRDEVRVYPKTPQGEMPEHDVVFNSDAAKLLKEAFQREPDMVASILPEGFAVVSVDYLRQVVKMLSDAVPVSASRLSLGGDVMADEVLRFSADRLYGVSELARRKRDEEERRR